MRQPQPWNSDFRPFDEEARNALVNLIAARRVRSIAQACRVLGLSSATVYRWISRGKSEDYGDHDWHYKHFYLRLLRAAHDRTADDDEGAA